MTPAKGSLRVGRRADPHPPGGIRGTENGTPPVMDRHRAYGKAPTFNTNDSGTFKRAVDMTDDELAAIVAKAKLLLFR